jgi:uncharacterized cofD-like protein
MRNGDGAVVLRRFSRWLSPGMQLKRWLLVALIGTFLFLDGFARVLNSHFYNFHINETIDRLVVQGAGLSPALLQWTLMLFGAVLIYYGLRQWMRSIAFALSPQDSQRMIEVIYERRQLDRGCRIVTVGGGTGLSTLLRGLKEYTSNLTAIVTVTDDGGSSGRLRQELGVLPPGDIRNCLVALADSEATMTDLFQYRFNEGNGLTGHSFGNLFLAAMCGIAGNFDQAIKESSKVLNIKGRVLPSTLSNVAIEATLADGSRVLGETAISKAHSPIRKLALVPAECAPLAEALEAIAAADVIVLGPGSLYTSIMPNLLVPGVADAVARANALKVYVCNIMTQPGETDGMSASAHAGALLAFSPTRLFDFALVNIEQPTRLLRLYESGGAHQVVADFDAIAALGVTPVPGRFVSEAQQVRHDTKKLAQAIVKLIVERGDWAGVPATRRPAGV